MGEFRVHHVRFFEYQPKAIHCIAYNENTEELAISRSDGTIEFWSIRDQWFQETIIPGIEGKSIEALCWQGQRLFTAGLDGYVTEYDTLRLQPKAIATSNAGPIWCLTSDPSGKFLAAGTEDGCVVLFDTDRDSLEFKRSFDKQESRILCIAWHSAGETIVTGGIDNIRLWSVNSGHAYQRLSLPRQEKNTETIVWCLAVTRELDLLHFQEINAQLNAETKVHKASDMTIVSGDSRGKTSFWNGEHGTLIKSFMSHKADVFCLCMDKSETSVLSSGVDSTVVQFEYTATQKDSDWKVWVKSLAHFRHTHDVRALALVKDHIVSGGVDTSLIVYRLQFEKGKKIWRKLPSIPHKSMVQVAREAELILIKHTDSLDVWRLGRTNKTSKKNGEILPPQCNPLKLVQLKNKSDEPIMCFAISSHGNSIAFSDQNSVRVYSLIIENKELINPSIQLKKLKFDPAEDSLAPLPAHHMVITSDGNTIITATVNGNIQMLSKQNDRLSVDHNFPALKEQPDSITMMCLSPNDKRVAIGDSGRNVTVYDITTKQILSRLPRYSCQVTALSFTPSSQELVMAYADQVIYEFDLVAKEYSAWSKKHSNKFPYQWKKRHSKISRIFFQHEHPEKIFLHDEQMLCIIDKTQPFPKADAKLFNKATWSQDGGQGDSAFHICSKYKFILHLDAVKDDWLIVVERPPAAITDNLPPTLKMKKFGT